jgi:hypothetical protein
VNLNYFNPADWTGPHQLAPCYNAPCMLCRKRVRGVVYYKETVDWDAGGINGVSFYYAHLVCFKENKKAPGASIPGALQAQPSS